MNVTREMLAAYADGQLGPEDAAHVEAALAADPVLAQEVETHKALRAQLSAHFAPILDMPVPDALKRPLETPAQIVDLAAARQAKEEKAAARATLPHWAMGGALAASLALGVMIGGQWPQGDQIRSEAGQLVAGGALEKALTTQLASTQGDDAPVRILLSFKSGDGHYCRGFETGATSGIACRTDGNWGLVRTQSSRTTGTTEYRQAGSAQAEIMAAAQEMTADGALDANAEQAARNSGWQD